MKLYQICESVYLSDVAGYHYWYNENSLSRSNRKERFLLLGKTVSAIEEKFIKYQITDEEYRIAEYFWANFKKCVNQEVRYIDNGKYDNSEHNIKYMLSIPVTKKYLEIIHSNHNLPKEQLILCSLLLNERIKTLILILRVYNLLKH